MNFVTLLADSVIHTLITRNSCPFGPVSAPLIRYLSPYSVVSSNVASSGRSCVRVYAVRAWSTDAIFDDLRQVVGEAVCDFLGRAFHHHAAHRLCAGVADEDAPRIV